MEIDVKGIRIQGRLASRSVRSERSPKARVFVKGGHGRWSVAVSPRYA